ncbi:hypothetical protein ACYSNM_09635 [Myroides sp. LJL116]
MSKHYIICQNCRTENVNQDYCSNCNEIINIQLKRELAQKKVVEKRIQEEINRPPTKIEKKIQALENHSNILVRGVVRLIKGVYVVVMTIGAIFAYIISMILA